MNGQVVVIGVSSHGCSWELATVAPDARLRQRVISYTDYAERATGPRRHREFPVSQVILNFGYGSPLRMFDGDAAPDSSGRLTTSFVAGLYTSPAEYEHDGEVRGVEVRLTPLGARMLLGLSMAELAGRAIDVRDVFGAPGRELVERLAEARDRETRFRILDRALQRKLADALPPPAGVEWAWQELRRTRGRRRIRTLADEWGWSPRRLIEQFREHVGIPPKSVARVIRFEHAVQLLGRAADRNLASIAAHAGYYDQPHLDRDFRSLGGTTPSEYLARRACVASPPDAREDKARKNVQDAAEARL